jgi:NAD(P)-dependent dehydrogenase (short-subunit alcohol dehydrogenase family)
MPNWLEGRHAVVTGGGSGIGASAATHLNACGAKVSVLGRTKEKLEFIAKIVSGQAVQCDVTQRDSIRRAYDEARQGFGPISFLIVNAGVADSAPFAKTPRESWDRIIATNLTAAFDCVQEALADLLAGEDSRIVFVASVAGLRGVAYGAPYAASKHGLIGMMRSLALEYAKTSMTVNAVCPGYVDTQMTMESAGRISAKTGRSFDQSMDALAGMNASGRLVHPDSVGFAIAQLCLLDARDTNGAILTVDGGTSA